MAEVLEATAAEQAEADAARAAELAAGAIDGKTATPEQLQERFNELGITSVPLPDSHGTFDPRGFRRPGDHKPPPAPEPTPAERAAYKRAVATEVVERLILSGKPINVKRLNGLELEVYLKKTGREF